MQPMPARSSRSRSPFQPVQREPEPTPGDGAGAYCGPVDKVHAVRDEALREDDQVTMRALVDGVFSYDKIPVRMQDKLNSLLARAMPAMLEKGTRHLYTDLVIKVFQKDIKTQTIQALVLMGDDTAVHTFGFRPHYLINEFLPYRIYVVSITWLSLAHQTLFKTGVKRAMITSVIQCIQYEELIVLRKTMDKKQGNVLEHFLHSCGDTYLCGDNWHPCGWTDCSCESQFHCRVKKAVCSRFETRKQICHYAAKILFVREGLMDSAEKKENDVQPDMKVGLLLEVLPPKFDANLCHAPGRAVAQFVDVMTVAGRPSEVNSAYCIVKLNQVPRHVDNQPQTVGIDRFVRCIHGTAMKAIFFGTITACTVPEHSYNRKRQTSNKEMRFKMPGLS